MTGRYQTRVWAASRSRSRISIIDQYLLRYPIDHGWFREFAVAMALRPLFAPLRPDLDPFLFAVVREERDGIPLSTISALAQLGLDPWDEAGRLAGLAKRDAVEQLTGLLLRLPGPSRPLAEEVPEEVRQIAVALIDVLPRASGIAKPAGTRGTGPATTLCDRAFWIICCVLVATAVLIMLTN
jgi:hypothetical protein